MAKYPLNFVQRPSRIDEERSVLMARVMDTQGRQSSLAAQPLPDLMHTHIGLSRLPVGEQIVECPFRAQLVEDIDGAIIQRDRANALRLRVAGRNAPDPIDPVDLAPLRVQGFVQAGIRSFSDRLLPNVIISGE